MVIAIISLFYLHLGALFIHSDHCVPFRDSYFPCEQCTSTRRQIL